VSRPIKHQQSHASLLHDVSAASVPAARRGLDAIVVPASRPSLQRVINLSVELSVPLVVLCSKQAKAERVADRVDATFGARALVVDVPGDYDLWAAPRRTSAPRFLEASAGRLSDLSVKRNLGLLLARMRGWRKILFLDDDIYRLRAQDIARLADQLDRHPVAAMASRVFPDNSVVCHARRAAGLGQDIFVSGAVLGVNTQHDALSFFPDIYNEDWFFFARHAAERSLPKVGEVRQDEYEPFADPMRAAREEFGDLLAEGLYALFESTPGLDFGEQLSAATRQRYWELFIEDRMAMITSTKDTLTRVHAPLGSTADLRVLQAEDSLRHARKQLRTITPELCAEFIECWREDALQWQGVMRGYGSVLSEREALDELGLSTGYSCGYGRTLAMT
jgi:hypothetical protein